MNRKQFLKTSSAVLAGSFVPSFLNGGVINKEGSIVLGLGSNCKFENGSVIIGDGLNYDGKKPVCAMGHKLFGKEISPNILYHFTGEREQNLKDFGLFLIEASKEYKNQSSQCVSYNLGLCDYCLSGFDLYCLDEWSSLEKAKYELLIKIQSYYFNQIYFLSVIGKYA